MGKKTRQPLVLFLTVLGFTILLVTSIPVTSIEEAIHISFTIHAGTTYEPPEAGTSYHTRINILFSKSVLKGEVMVEGEGIDFTVSGYNAKQLKNLYVTDRYSFKINPADDLYTFRFENTTDSTESQVTFTLEEIWTRPLALGSPPLFIAGGLGFFLFITGLVTLMMSYLKN